MRANFRDSAALGTLSILPMVAAISVKIRALSSESGIALAAEITGFKELAA